ncbi:WD40-repeat-containing domain protein [Radiomyces spectabilis]|uniref:WD40-repeat-containing domain protein n=1 Tax=Radiomyces spectabilis TaxID=64574 RepID=UPI00221E3B36|nr:WD40-repeat-containing domain protein [Radiomyces spectabilis]KAI8371348.1 WD40-repeat-containing domain protein [Radiomyces spectabilis]
MGVHSSYIRPTEDIFNANDPRIKEDIIGIIMQYLADEGYHASQSVLYDETNVKWKEREERIVEVKRLKKAILDGDWQEVEKLCTKPLVKNHRSFLYSVYRQQYLEYIERREIQKAFTFLNKRLKPLEHLQTKPTEFKDLCYLLTAKSIHEAPSFRNWEGVMSARENLVDQLQSMLDFETADRNGNRYIPPDRLLTLLRQSVAYQIEFSRYHPKIAPAVNSLVEDYTSFVIPNAVGATLTGHRGNVKCVEFIGDDGREIVSGSSDNTLRIWDTETAECLDILEGHRSRIWDLSSTVQGDFVASASGDGTVKIWNLSSTKASCANTLNGHAGDVYSVKYHPNQEHVVTGGYDKTVRLFDVNTGAIVKTFPGHQLAVTKTIFNPLGNLVISGSKDNTIKFWDIVSGLCIRTISSHLGEVTSVEMNSSGTLLLSSSKDNSNRLWDVRMVRPIRKLKGHQNTSKNFVRAGFANNNLIVGGSEDGVVYIWDQDTGEVLQKLRGHTGVVYEVASNAKQGILASCSDDQTVKVWWYDEKIPMDT